MLFYCKILQVFNFLNTKINKMKKLFFLSLTLLSSLNLNSIAPELVKKTPKKGIDIQKALDYPLPHVVARYKKDYKVSDEDAKIHETELKKFLILAAENYPDKKTEMYSKKVDDFWHTFLLFTKDYEKYCKEVLGQFVHHVPKTEEEKSKRLIK